MLFTLFTLESSGYNVEGDFAGQEARHLERDHGRRPEQGGSRPGLELVPLQLDHPQPRSEHEQPQFHRINRFIVHCRSQLNYFS
jgi:hypothetical protein